MPQEWQPSNELVEVLDSAWIQAKAACEKIKEHTTATKKYISKVLMK